MRTSATRTAATRPSRLGATKLVQLALQLQNCLRNRGYAFPIHDQAPEVPATGNHAGVIVGVAQVLDAPGRSCQQALAEITASCTTTIMGGQHFEYYQAVAWYANPRAITFSGGRTYFLYDVST